MDSFWDYVWYTILVFAFVAYLIVLFHIIVDLFRDRELSGWAKGAWMIVLVFFPYISSFVYLVARGRGMATRAQEAQVKAREATDNYIREVASSKSPVEQISDASTLLDAGAITTAEFEQIKANALDTSVLDGASVSPRVTTN